MNWDEQMAAILLMRQTELVELKAQAKREKIEGRIAGGVGLLLLLSFIGILVYCAVKG